MSRSDILREALLTPTSLWATMNPMDDALSLLRDATLGTEFDGRLFLVGGYVRDRLLGRGGSSDDIDLVLEGDAPAVAQMLWRKRVARHKPVIFETFGTAMVHVGDAQVELVTARAETYRQGSRKPIVTPGTLLTDAQRRDFTVNTLLQNLHTGEVLDLLGTGRDDLAAGVLRTPLDPTVTFTDDPLRMLRACRFAAKLGFSIAPETYAALSANAFRLSAEHGISNERIHDELNKTLLAPGASVGLELMRVTGLLVRFAPELDAMHGVTQNRWHVYDVWEHTRKAVSLLPADADLGLRLATLLHDVGKPATRTVDAAGEVHFYEHEHVGAAMARELLTRLRYDLDTIKRVASLVDLHMRYGAYDPNVWSEAALRRLIRVVGEHRRDLFVLGRADTQACGTEIKADLDGLEARLEAIESASQITKADSPLTGQELMARLGIPPGPQLGKIKAALVDAVVAGELAPDDKDGAEAIARRLLG